MVRVFVFFKNIFLLLFFSSINIIFYGEKLTLWEKTWCKGTIPTGKKGDVPELECSSPVTVCKSAPKHRKFEKNYKTQKIADKKHEKEVYKLNKH